MPLQGNDNSSTRSWMPKPAVAPSAKWNSTYAVHYKNPAKRFSRNHEYWLRKASERAEATAQLAAQGVQLEPRSAHTFRNPSLSLAFNQPLRNPSSTARDSLQGSTHGLSVPGSLTARPLASNIRDTSRRSYNHFDAHAAQQSYGTPYSVSALAMLEGQAAATHNFIPLQATARPHVERQYRVVGPHNPFGSHEPQSYGSTARPASARPAQTLTYREPAFEQNTYQQQDALYSSLPRQAAWTETQHVPQQQFSLTAPRSQYVLPETRPAAGYTQRALDPVTRSQTFRPQLSASSSSPMIPANTLLDVAAAPERFQKRAAEYQSGQYQELSL